MALTTCPECSGKVSDRVYSCPHCSFPMRDGISDGISPPVAKKRTAKQRSNGSGTIVKLSYNRKKPYQVRVNTRIDGWGYPRFDILGTFPDRVSADIALAEYNKDPYNLENRHKTFKAVFYKWYKWKYKKSAEDRECFQQALTLCGITTKHTPHDCRHTCNMLMDDAGMNRTARYKIMRHAGKDINERVYSHKSVNELRKELEKI